MIRGIAVLLLTAMIFTKAAATLGNPVAIIIAIGVLVLFAGSMQ